MDKRTVLLSIVGLVAAGMTSKAFAQESELPSPNELIGVLQDDQQFSLMRSGVWVLREILALGRSPEEQDKDREKFIGYLERVEQNRKTIIEVVQKYNNDLPMQDKAKNSVPNVLKELQRIGVNPASELAKRLIRSYVQFNQSLSAVSDNTNSLCDVFPFGYACG